ncbi:MAG TPA: carbohydrate-binding family 9-like protein [Tepidisphaeraceae bacterium]|jgi:hypothetical protein
MPSYLIHRTSTDFKIPQTIADWDDRAWNHVAVAEISHFHPRSSDFHPITQARLMHDGQRIFLRFDVQDRYVISTASQYQDAVFKDSCVEFFFRPKPQSGYFNLEVNCGGTKLMSYVEDPSRAPDGLKKWRPVDAADADKIIIHHSMPSVVDPEITEPTHWRNGEIIPISALEPYCGKIGNLSGQTWTGNLFKCVEKNSHPHWATWSPIGEQLNFHQPKYFADFRFE